MVYHRFFILLDAGNLTLTSQEEAIIRFRRLKEEDKKHRQLQELKRMNSRLN